MYDHALIYEHTTDTELKRLPALVRHQHGDGRLDASAVGGEFHFGVSVSAVARHAGMGLHMGSGALSIHRVAALLEVFKSDSMTMRVSNKDSCD